MQFEPREYQLKIAEKASKTNTLVVLPTGLGKTLIAAMVAKKRLEKHPQTKILILAPTRPLAAQHKETFEKFLNQEVFLITGKVNLEKRKEMYKVAKIISATPQVILNDLERKIFDLSDFSLVVFDEAHRAVKDYAYVPIAKKYYKTSRYSLILGLTASPGSSRERIDEICDNLFIKQIEIRTEKDLDVKKYVKPVKFEWVYVDLTDDLKRIREELLGIEKEIIQSLKERGVISKKLTKKELINLHKKLVETYKQTKNGSLFGLISKLSILLKIEHILELLETQGMEALRKYFEKLKKSNKKFDKVLMNNEKIRRISLILSLSKEKEHPKVFKLVELIKQILKKNEKAKIIVFANYRDTVKKLNEILRNEGIKSDILIGQARKGKGGLTQKEQIEKIKKFANLEFNVLCGTSITEEGLDIPQVDYTIFYEPVPSEIRSIQRRGRTGRTHPGTVIFLITKKTRDEAYYWAAFHKEKKMKGILFDLKNRKTLKKTLFDWLKV